MLRDDAKSSSIENVAALPPWRHVEEWHEANQTMVHLMQLHKKQLDQVSNIADSISRLLQAVFPDLASLCNQTCPWCPEPCCMAATVWFDFKDLVFQHASGYDLPPNQVKRDRAGHCSYLGAKGCRLDRFSRPWICTWYICESQKRILFGRERHMKLRIDKTLGTIRQLRRKLETTFIEVCSGKR